MSEFYPGSSVVCWVVVVFFCFDIVQKCLIPFFCSDSNWNIECWIKGKLDVLVCSLRFLKLYLRADLKVNLLYAV